MWIKMAYATLDKAMETSQVVPAIDSNRAVVLGGIKPVAKRRYSGSVENHDNTLSGRLEFDSPFYLQRGSRVLAIHRRYLGEVKNEHGFSEEAMISETYPVAISNGNGLRGTGHRVHSSEGSFLYRQWKGMPRFEDIERKHNVSYVDTMLHLRQGNAGVEGFCINRSGTNKRIHSQFSDVSAIVQKYLEMYSPDTLVVTIGNGLSPEKVIATINREIGPYGIQLGVMKSRGGNQSGNKGRNAHWNKKKKSGYRGSSGRGRGSVRIPA